MLREPGRRAIRSRDPTRRTLLRRATAVAAWMVAGATGGVRAQAADPHALRLVVPFSPGGGSDGIARLIQNRLGEVSKTAVVIDNRPGAGGTLGAAIVAKAPPDGTTLLLADASVATIAPALYPKLPYATRDLVPVTGLSQFANVLVAPTRLSANTLAELLAQQRARATPLTIASSGNGTSTHLTAELLKTATGLPLTHVPYRGTGPAINDTIAGQVDLLFTGWATVSQLVRAGRLKVLAVTSPKRLPELPNVPTVAESGYPGFEAWIAQGVFAPAGTSQELVHRQAAAFVEVLRQPEVAARMREQGFEPLGSSPDAFAAWIDGQARLWTRVVRDAGVKPE